MKLRVFSPGDIVGLYQSNRHNESGQSGGVEGVVYKVNNEEIVIAFSEMHDFVSDTTNADMVCTLVGIDEAAPICCPAR